MPSATARKKARLAALCATLWLLGFDVVPLAHMVFHEGLEQHDHGHHADHVHRHGDEEQKPPPADHGEGSVAHRDLAASVPLPAVPEVLEALFAWDATSFLPRTEVPANPQLLANRARAPPCAATA